MTSFSASYMSKTVVLLLALAVVHGEDKGNWEIHGSQSRTNGQEIQKLGGSVADQRNKLGVDGLRAGDYNKAHVELSRQLITDATKSLTGHAGVTADNAGRLKGNGLSEFVGGSKLISPFFDPNTPLNVSAQIGKSAYLTCIVHNVGNMSVSWVRHRDIHILTVGAYTYTSDQRFMSLHKRETNEWTLQIKWVQKRDAGMYECQVSSIPVMSLFVHLAVVVPSAVIHGTSDVHIEYGSTINLTCSINYATESPAYIFWYHHDKSGKIAVVNYDSDRGGISVITVKAEVSTSHLVIRGAREADAGKYYCSPSNADVAFVHVHVHSSKSPSAIQTSVGTLGNSYLLMVLAMVLITVST